MSSTENKPGRPSRRHAHVCRTCDETFGCKAELLEHEQEEHSGMLNKVSKQKQTKATINETSVATSGEPEFAEVVNKSNRKSVISVLNFDREEVYKGASRSLLNAAERSKLNSGTRSLVWQGRRSTSQASYSLPTADEGKRKVNSTEQQGSLSLDKTRGIKSIAAIQKGDQDFANVDNSSIKVAKSYAKPGQSNASTIKCAMSSVDEDGSKSTLKRCSDVRDIVGLKRNKKESGSEELITSEAQCVKTASGDTKVQLLKKADTAKSDMSTARVMQHKEKDRKIMSSSQQSVGVVGQNAGSSQSITKADQSHKLDNVALKDGFVQDGQEVNVLQCANGEAVLVANADENIDNADTSKKASALVEPETSEIDIQLQPMFIATPECFSEITVDTSQDTTMKKKSPKLSSSESAVGSGKRVFAVAVMPPSPTARVLVPNSSTGPRKSNCQRMVSVLLRNQDVNRLGVVADLPEKQSGGSQIGERSYVECAAVEEIIEEVIADEPESHASVPSTNGSTDVNVEANISIQATDSKSQAKLANTTAQVSASDLPSQSISAIERANASYEESSSPDEQSAAETDKREDQLDPEQTGVVEGDIVNSLIKEEGNEEIGTKANLTADDLNAIESDQPGNCRLCGKGYENGVELMNHMVVDHICHQCGKEFRQPSNLRKHVRISHDNIRPHECPVCGRGFAFASNLSSHLAVHFPVNVNERPYACNQCDRTFRHPASLRKHMKEEHLEGPKPYACTECDKAFVYKCALDLHMRKHSVLRPYTCPRCNAGFKHTANLQKHIKIMHPGPCSECGDESAKCEHALATRAATRAKNTCMECGRSYDSASSLAVHERVHRGIKLETCDLCGQGFQHRSNLQKHMMKHTGNKPHACTQCPRAFYARHNLIAHMRKHTGNSPYECDQCGKHFCTKNSLQVHMNLHANIRPFSCDVCGRQFSQLGNLQKHMTVHTGERPHVCSVCQRSFTDISALKRHMAAIHEHDARYVCDICNKRFLHLSSVRSHRLMHMGVKPHKCETCGKLFTHRSGYMRHLRLHERSDSLLFINERKEVVLKPGEYIVYLTE